ncbi:MAG: hypothetical protein AAGA48_23340 [Myxococcota bacterium]
MPPRMLMLFGAWLSCAMLTVWAFFVAGRLRSVWWARLALVAGLAPLVFLIVQRLPRPQLELPELGLTLGFTGILLGVWGAAVTWARELPASPKVDASRMRWDPRPSHRPTWVIVMGMSTLLTFALVAVQQPLLAVMPWGLLAIAYAWAHQGLRGPVRVEARDVVFGNERMAIDDLSRVIRDVRYFGPVRREHLVVKHNDRLVCWLVTGSPTEDVLAVVHLIHQQQAFAANHTIDRGALVDPPQWLAGIQERGARPFALQPNGEAT